MDRRSLLTGAGVAAAGAIASLPAPAIAQNVRELKMVTTWPKGAAGVGTSVERLALRINEMSDNRLQVKVFGAGDLIGAFEVFDAVSAGVADMYHSAENYWHDRSPAFSFFAAVPFGFTAPEINAWIYSGGGQALWDELSAGFGLKAFLCGNTGAQMGGWFTREITGLESYSGLRYRMPGLGGEVLRRLGAVVINLPGSEIIPALQSGAIDASEFAGPWVDMAVGLHEAAPYYYHPGFHEPGAALSLAVNKQLWDGLDSTERSIIETAAAAENDRSLAEFTANNAAALELLVKDPRIQIRRLDDTILRSLGRISSEVLAETSRNDELTRRIYDSHTAFRTAVVRWSEVSDRSYLNARALNIVFDE